jgi:SAM-dependent methyltransferase
VSGLRVLDLGCALGVRTAAAAKGGASRAVGVDIDLEKVHRACELAKRSGVSGISFTAQNGARLAFDEGRFDVVLMLDVIEHVPDPAAVLGECARVLRTGGRVLLSFPPYRSPWGGHLFAHVPIPWAHLVFSNREVLDVWRAAHRRAVSAGAVSCSTRRMRAIMRARTTADLWDCNGLTIGGLLGIVESSPLTIRSTGFKTLGNVGGWVMRSSMLREHLVTRFTAVLEA